MTAGERPMPESMSVSDYIDGLPEDRKKAVSEIRKTINKNLPKGFKESVGMGMIIWSVPHTSYPAGYHCDPSKPLMLIGLTATKGGVSLHHLGLYGSTQLLTWFTSEWPKHASKKLDMGKGCVRFKSLNDVPLDLIGELATKLTPLAWVEQYEQALKMRAKQK
jgi:uncharacterized protein YdhG (YjbR/CyaY superfamily)